MKKENKDLLNEKIRAKEVRLIDHDGTQLGIVSLTEAISIASQKNLDVLLVSPNAEPPVCRVLNYGQFKYQQNKKDKQAKKSNKSNIVKEIKMSPKISIHDYTVRVNHSKNFLEKGYRVKLTIPFRGREIMHKDLGNELAQRFIEDIKDFGTPDSELQSAPRSLVVQFKSNK